MRKLALENSRNNREAVHSAQLVGCFFCVETFDARQVKDYCDNGNTALCPQCGVDSVLPSETCLETLSDLCEIWFTGRVGADADADADVRR